MNKKQSMFGIFMLIVILFLLGVVAYNLLNSEPSTDYKALYEEDQYNKTLLSAFTNGTIIGENNLKLQMMELGSTCQDVVISAFYIPTNQTVSMKLKWVECA